MKNQKFECHSVIKFLVLGGESSSDIYKRMVVLYGDHALSPTTVFQWSRRCKDAQLNIEDNRRCARPITNETFKDVESLIIEDRRITIQQIAYVRDVTTYTVHRIIHI